MVPTRNSCLTVLALLVLAACSRHQDGSSLVDRSFLTGQPCTPPCWYGLEPEKATEEDVISTLKTLPFVESSTITVTKVVQGAPLVANEQRVWFDCREPEERHCGLALLSGDKIEGALSTCSVSVDDGGRGAAARSSRFCGVSCGAAREGRLRNNARLAAGQDYRWGASITTLRDRAKCCETARDLIGRQKLPAYNITRSIPFEWH